MTDNNIMYHNIIYIAGTQLTYVPTTFLSPELNLPLFKSTQIIADPIYLAPNAIHLIMIAW